MSPSSVNASPPSPAEAGGALARAGALVEAGQVDLAESEARAALAAAPLDPSAHGALARVLLARGRAGEARDHALRAAEGEPADAPSRSGLATLLLECGLDAQAARHAARATTLEPSSFRAWFLAGIAWHRLGRHEEAVAALQRAVALDPDDAAARHNLGAVFLALGRFAECEAESRAALERMPGLVEAGINRAAALFALGRSGESEAVLRAMLEARPGTALVHFNLATLLMKHWRGDEALPFALNAAKLAPRWPQAHALAGELLGHLSRYPEAATALELAIALAPDEARWKVLRALLLPVIPASRAQIDASREDMRRRVARISGEALRLDDPAAQVGFSTFYLAYHGQDNAALNREVAAMYEKLCPSLLWRAPESAPRPRAGRRLRVGFLSACFYEHTVGRLTQGLIARLDRSRFEVVVLRADSRAGDDPAPDRLAAQIDAAADRVVRLPRVLAAARERVAAERLDVLLYPDVGMSPFVTYLAYSRLAPVQAVTWGHPDTTGIGNLDYFVSSSAIEPPGAQAHYTERLVELARLPAYYGRPERPPPSGLRERLGFAREARLYVCPQSLFKFHPDFDAILGRLLAADPDGLLVLVASRFRSWNAALLERLAGALGEDVRRVRYIEFLPQAEFLELLSIADAVLDPPGFGGGNSSYEALGIGVPVVTLPGPFMRGRVTLGCYRQIGMETLVARSPEEYVELALRLARDAPFRDECRARLRELSPGLFEDDAAVRELESFFERAFDEAAAVAGVA